MTILCIFWNNNTFHWSQLYSSVQAQVRCWRWWYWPAWQANAGVLNKREKHTFRPKTALHPAQTQAPERLLHYPMIDWKLHLHTITDLQHAVPIQPKWAFENSKARYPLKDPNRNTPADVLAYHRANTRTTLYASSRPLVPPLRRKQFDIAPKENFFSFEVICWRAKQNEMTTKASCMIMRTIRRWENRKDLSKIDSCPARTKKL